MIGVLRIAAAGERLERNRRSKTDKGQGCMVRTSRVASKSKKDIVWVTRGGTVGGRDRICVGRGSGDTLTRSWDMTAKGSAENITGKMTSNIAWINHITR